MIQYIQDWVKNIVIYLILITIIQSLLPQGQYIKYIKVFTGLILMFIILMPIASFSGINEQINMGILNERYRLDHNLVKKQYSELSKEQEQLIAESYTREIENQIKYLLEKDDIVVNDVGVRVDTEFQSDTFGEITQVNINASLRDVKESETIKINQIIISSDTSTEVKTPEQIVYEKRIKNHLINFYNLSTDNINISISH
ncbi:stage III sporulation protein AF [Natranaerovirga hydrolytica]|uniref:Stage III sporulation protein AF n=1 Tax=Natranaerovirga hydrolytica TaxID=680378 RepID=A0A4R1N6U3_9FIRM|nr:stage III sporulation protein AF [Natranaerovirga hydrolytica]TCK98363.1 stage III sporulation protein AF [Natranaerovirga hydrolytica]